MSSEEQQLRNRSKKRGSRGCGHEGAGEGRALSACTFVGAGATNYPSARCPTLPLLCTHQPGPRTAKSCEPGGSETHGVKHSAGAGTQGLFHPIYILQLLMPPHNSSRTGIPNENVRNEASCNYWEVAQASSPFLFHRTPGKSEVSGGEQRPPLCLEQGRASAGLRKGTLSTACCNTLLMSTELCKSREQGLASAVNPYRRLTLATTCLQPILEYCLSPVV